MKLEATRVPVWAAAIDDQPAALAQKLEALAEAGFFRTDALHSIRVVGRDRPGIGTAITRAVADLGVNLRGYSGSVIGSRFIGYVALDDLDETAKVVRALRKL